MRASEFLRSLANTLAALETGIDTPAELQKNDKIDDNVGEFTPPLQTKIELLKKANNVKSVYDDNAANTSTPANPADPNTQEASEDDGPFE